MCIIIIIIIIIGDGNSLSVRMAEPIIEDAQAVTSVLIDLWNS